MVEFTATQADTVAAYRRHGLDRLLRWPTFATLLLVTGITFGLAVVLLPSESKAASVLIIPGAALGGIAFPLAITRFRVQALARRVHRQRANSSSAIVISWFASGFAAQTSTANSLTPWNHYFRWQEDRQVVLLYLTEVLFQFIPKRVLTAEQLVSLRTCAAAGGVRGARR